jgi:conjugative transfer signal peptidase TraF
MRRGPAFLVIVAASVGIAATYAIKAGYRFNTTTSMPIGIWRITPAPAAPARGMIVAFCMDDGPTTKMALQRGYVDPGACPSGGEPLLKQIAATPGDSVVLGPAEIRINGTAVPNSAPRPSDPAGRALPVIPPGEYRVADDEVWLLSTHTPLSFDSRYYGPVRITNIIGSATPVFVR